MAYSLDIQQPATIDGEFYINIIETNCRRNHDPLRVAVSPGLSVRKLLVQVVNTLGEFQKIDTLCLALITLVCLKLSQHVITDFNPAWFFFSRFHLTHVQFSTQS